MLRNFHSLLDCLIDTVSFCVSIIIIGLFLAYYVYSIAVLIHHDLNCTTSHLHIYISLSLIFSSFRIIINKFDCSGTFIYLSLTTGVFEILLALWGGLELWLFSCNHDKLWTCGVVTFSIQLLFASIFMIVIPTIIYFIRKKPENYHPIESV